MAGDGEGFSLEAAGVEIAAATQRSSDCGDINPVLTAEQASDALQELFDLSDGLLDPPSLRREAGGPVQRAG